MRIVFVVLLLLQQTHHKTVAAATRTTTTKILFTIEWNSKIERNQGKKQRGSEPNSDRFEKEHNSKNSHMKISKIVKIGIKFSCVILFSASSRTNRFIFFAFFSSSSFSFFIIFCALIRCCCCWCGTGALCVSLWSMKIESVCQNNNIYLKSDVY